MRPLVLVAALALVLLAPAASDGQEPHSTHDTTALFVCGVVQDDDSLRAALDYQFDPDRAHSSEAARAGCNGTCVVDVGFFYYPEAIDGTGGCTGNPNSSCNRRAASIGELRRYLIGALVIVNGIYQDSGVDVEFRLERLVPAGSGRSRWADLWYEINPQAGGGTEFAGRANVPRRNSDGSPRWVKKLDGTVTFVSWVYREYRGRAGPNFFFWPHALAHEFGHSLGLRHGSDDLISPGVSPWRGGNAYLGIYEIRRLEGSKVWYGTTMSSIPGNKFPRFSDSGESLYGRPIGDRQANAVEVLRQNVPHLASRAPSRATTDYGCPPSDCIDRAGRFEVKLFSFNDLEGFAKRLPAPVGPNAALYYFFDPANPEVLVKVLNGCGVNGHWWVFASAATDLPYSFWLTDLATERQLRYRHSGGLVSGSNGFSGAGVINDVRAFTCEP